ncbi:MAG: glycosyltransferase family 39 protein [Polyangiaceae bacterium]|nr:glycosyltransferase family 39 protein [Polyangiaceae bacterium]
MAGLWDPHEIRVADLARRAALHLYGAPLSVPDADNGLPTLGDLGRGDLPLALVALSFRLFGLSAWAGRLPLALATAAGLAVTYFWLRRCVSAQAGAWGALVAATTPLIAVQGRTLLGDAVTMTCFISALAGLSVVSFDDRPGRARWAVVGALGLAGGLASRGALFGIVVPAAAVGAAGLVARLGPRPGERPAPWWGSCVLLAVAAGLAVPVGGALAHAAPGPLDRWLGSAAVVGQKWPTFDVIVQQIGHALFPWSALVPVAFARVLGRAPGDDPAEASREDRARLVLALGAAFAVAAHALAMPIIGAVPFVAPYAVAAVIALSMLDVARGRHTSRAVVLIAALLLLVLSLDLARMPEKGLAPYGIAQATAPDAWRADGGALARASAVVVGLGLLLAFADGAPPRPLDRARPLLDRLTAWREVDEIFDELGRVWKGNLTFSAVMLEAMLVGFGALLFFAERFSLRLSLRDALSQESKRILLNAWWALPLAVTGGLFVALTAKKLFDAALAATGTCRGKAALLAGAAGASVMTLAYHPALASRLSPRAVFATFERVRRGDEPLGLYGVSGKSAAYYGARSPRVFTDQDQAFAWLVEGPERRFLALRDQDLARFNTLFRGRPHAAQTPDHNLPVLAGDGSQTLLVSSALSPGEVSHNALARFVSSTPPRPQRPLDVELEGQVRALGWSLFDAKEERLQTYAVPRKTYVLCLYYEVLATPGANWKGFIHIDGYGRRFNGDHDVLLGKLPMTAWTKGDFITDRYEVTLEPNFSPGAYDLYFGFFIGDRRLAVTRGKHHENRVQGGAFVVR